MSSGVRPKALFVSVLILAVFAIPSSHNAGSIKPVPGMLGDEAVTFSNVSEQIGLGGVTASFLQWGDYDDDGDLDLLTDGTRLFRNNGIPTGTWDFTEVTGASGITGGAGVWGDYDRDGYLDTFGQRLWHNDGDGTFTDVTGAAFIGGIPWPQYITCAGWGDYDKDGHLDLYIARGEDWNDGSPIYYPDDLWRNNGDGTFTNVTSPAGIAAVEGTGPSEDDPPSYGRGVSWVDYDNDGWSDIYVANYRWHDNHLFRNNGDGTFTNTAPDVGLHDGAQDLTDDNNQDPYTRGGHTIGAVWGDIDNDGDFDAWVNNFNHKDWRTSDDALLCRNEGPPTWNFTNYAGTAGIHRKPWGVVSGPEGDDLLAGNALGDYDNDGDLDLWLTQVYGDVSYAYSYLYRHDLVANQTFTDVTESLGVRVWDTYAGIFVDYDNDGDLDLATAGKYPYADGTYMVRIFQNGGNANSWLKVKLAGDDCDKFGVGARIYVNQTSAPYLTLMDWIHTSQGAHNHANGLVAHFGLGSYGGTVNVTVKWPCGNVSYFDSVEVDQTIEINERDSSFSLSLSEGWNFVSAPLEGSYDVNTVIGNTTGGDVVGLQRYDAGGGEWTQWCKAKEDAGQGSLNTFASVDQKAGFWLNFDDTGPVGDGMITFEGEPPALLAARTVTLQPGWNMVGYPTNANRTVAQSFGTLWSNGWVACVEDEGGASLTGGDTMYRGNGYWVYLDRPGPEDWTCPL